ncbi:Translin [Ananas comosus]|uniref:Translin n=1 Tax=Ananas comosus TaxID=4615 RepID=A0A199V8L8_ANACO|nr:Translin [Ananas comosus]
MRTAFRTASLPALSSASSRLPPLPCSNPNPKPVLFLLLPLLRTPPFSLRRFSSSPPRDTATSSSSSSYSLPFMEKQFEDFRHQLDESGSVRERIRSVVMEMEAAARLVHSSLLLVHQSLPVLEVLEKTKLQIEVIKGLFGRLAEILRERPDQYYRYHGDWRSETQTVVSLLAFLHWLETGSLLMHTEAEKKLGLDSSEFGLDIEDYLIGLCFMSNELPRYVVNQVTAGDYDCPRKVLKFLTDLHAAFRMLNLRNDFLRKKFDGMKYDLRRVEEVYYDVKIRGLASTESTQDETAQA